MQPQTSTWPQRRQRTEPDHSVGWEREPSQQYKSRIHNICTQRILTYELLVLCRAHPRLCLAAVQHALLHAWRTTATGNR